MPAASWIEMGCTLWLLVGLTRLGRMSGSWAVVLGTHGSAAYLADGTAVRSLAILCFLNID